MEESLPDNTIKCKDRKLGAKPSSVGNDIQPLVEISNRHAPDHRGGSKRAKQPKEALSNTTLGRIQMASLRKESDRLQENCNSSHGELSDDEVVPNTQPNHEMRPPSVLQGGNTKNSKIMEVELGGIHKPSEESGMEHDGECNDGI